MPDAPLRRCRGKLGCQNYVKRGRCHDCAMSTDLQRGSRQFRSFDKHWDAFKLRFQEMMVDAGILPKCGAKLPGGPPDGWSLCQAEGFDEFFSLHLDHEPPITPAEQAAARAGDRSEIDVPTRMQYLCDGCHRAKTKRQNQIGWRQR